MTTQITYELDKDDLIAFQRYALKTSPMLRKMRRLFFLLLISSSFYYTLGYGVNLLATAVLFMINITFCASVFLLLTWALNEYAFRKSLPRGENNGLTGRHQLIVDEHKLVEITSVNEAHQQWQGMDRVVENKQYIYIFNMPHAAHIVPKRAFPDRQHAEWFFKTVQTLIARAKGDATATARFHPQPLATATSAGASDYMPVAYFDERARSPIERVFSE